MADLSSISNKKSNETTLTHLTKRFVKLLNSSSERVINLNEASTKLSVAKRRIYDITNVLEGIGLLQKTSKNVTRWIDCPRDSPYAAPPATANHHNSNPSSANCAAAAVAAAAIASGGGGGGGGGGDTPGLTAIATTGSNPSKADLNATLSQSNTTTTTNTTITNINTPTDPELLALLNTHKLLEESVNDLEAKIRQQLSAEEVYVTYHDIKSFFNDQIVIAVRAPPDTRLEVNESLQIWLKSENGQIEAYLCKQNETINNSNTNNTNTNNNTTQQQLQQSSQYYDYSTDDYDPTLSSALSGTVSEEEDPFRPLVAYESREEPTYNFMLDENFTLDSIFPPDNLGFY